MRDESYLPDYDFEIYEDFKKAAGSISSGFSSRSRDSTRPTTVSSLATSRSSSPDSSSTFSPLYLTETNKKNKNLRRTRDTNLLAHPRVPHPIGGLYCPKHGCDASFSNSFEWAMHLNVGHNAAVEIACWKHDCNGRKFNTVAHLFEHLKEMCNADLRHQCLKCGAKFPTENARDRHISYELCFGQSEVPVLQVSRPISACLLCRQAKSKCDGKSPCSSCIDIGMPLACSFQTAKVSVDSELQVPSYLLSKNSSARVREDRLDTTFTATEMVSVSQ